MYSTQLDTRVQYYNLTPTIHYVMWTTVDRSAKRYDQGGFDTFDAQNYPICTTAMHNRALFSLLVHSHRKIAMRTAQNLFIFPWPWMSLNYFLFN